MIWAAAAAYVVAIAFVLGSCQVAGRSDDMTEKFMRDIDKDGKQ